MLMWHVPLLNGRLIGLVQSADNLPSACAQSYGEFDGAADHCPRRNGFSTFAKTSAGEI